MTGQHDSDHPIAAPEQRLMIPPETEGATHSSPTLRCMAVGATLAMLCALPAAATAQANFQEDFDDLGALVIDQDGPPVLEQQGWIFKAQSGWQHQGHSNSWVWRAGRFYQPCGGFWTFEPRAGDGFLGTTSGNAVFQNGEFFTYNWAILPDIPNQVAGDVLTFWARRDNSLGGGIPVLEVRYSTGGGVDTGTAATDVGDFTEVLLEVRPVPLSAWAQYSVPLPGSGRIALRYLSHPIGSTCHEILGIDDLSVGPMFGPCDGYPNLPTAGQTVTWTAVGGPHVICSATEIPQGATVIVESGATVLVEPEYTLEVYGHLVVEEGATIDTPFQASLLIHGTANIVGTAGQPVHLTGGPRGLAFGLADRIAAMPGAAVTLDHVDLRTTFSSLGDGYVIADNVVADGHGNGFYVSGPTLFEGGNLAVRSSTFVNDSMIYSVGGYLLVDDLVLDNSLFEVQRPWAGQTLAIDNVVAVNRPAASVFQLRGADFWFGPGNSITGTAYPVQLNGAGLARGSVIPTSGNLTNRIHALPTGEGRVHWSAIDVPYEVQDTFPAPIAGAIVVDPGMTLLMNPGAGFAAIDGSYYGSNLVLKGLPEAPIILERADAGLPWAGVFFGPEGEHRSRLEHTILRGANSGLAAEKTVVRAESCLFEGNGIGVDCQIEAEIGIHGSRWVGNGIGARSADAPFFGGVLSLGAEGYPNSFEGNGIGVQTLNRTGTIDDLRNNWWGDPSGPQDESNPGGSGDSTPGSNQVVPFRTTPPIANHAPVVRLLPHSSLMEEGEKVILHWEATDDDAITGFRILYSPHGHNPGLSVLVDGIPGAARSWEIVVPEAPTASNYHQLSGFRVEGTDSFGQRGFDELTARIPFLEGYDGYFQPDTPSGVMTPGELFDVCGQWIGGASQGAGYETFLWLEGDDQLMPMGGSGASTCLPLSQEAPPFSTDLVRIMARHTGGAGGRITFGFSDYFEIRPPAAFGDAPPSVQLLAPQAGDIFQGGQVVNIEWAASDDFALREFDLHASYDGGRTWHTIARELQAGTSSYAWLLPPSSGISDVRVRVVARDSRFQNSSSTSAAFGVLAGPETVGTSYCIAAANSAGAGASISATGSGSVAGNDFHLFAVGLPPGQFGIFYYGPNPVMLPFGDGFRCVGGFTVRLQPAQQSTAGGFASRSVDLSQAPQAFDFIPGSTWRFQYWYRDPQAGGTGFNLTDGLEVLWQ